MASDFSRTLALLRKEKKISQRTAAGDLEVSQALLSHYENGLREPGLGFVVRAADYYGVSCDYLLGRSMARDGSAVSPSRIRAVSADTVDAAEDDTLALHRKLVVNSAALLFEIAAESGSGQLSAEIASYLSLAIYKVFRYLYMADPESVEAAFRTLPPNSTVCAMRRWRSVNCASVPQRRVRADSDWNAKTLSCRPLRRLI